jgi:hypothetical protein
LSSKINPFIFGVFLLLRRGNYLIVYRSFPFLLKELQHVSSIPTAYRNILNEASLLLKIKSMKKLTAVFVIIILGVLGFYAFKLGYILTKVFIGLMFIFVFALGIITGRIFKK